MELWIVETGLLAGECDDLAIILGGLTFFSSDLMDHAEAVVAVMHVGPALDQRPGGVLGVVEFSGVDESDHRIGRGVDLGVAVFAETGGMVR